MEQQTVVPVVSLYFHVLNLELCMILYINNMHMHMHMGYICMHV